MATNQKNEKPTVHNIRLGAVSVAIWTNQSEKGEYQTVTFERSYKDKNGQWQKSDSMRTNDLPKLKMLCDKAYEYMLTKHPDAE